MDSSISRSMKRKHGAEGPAMLATLKERSLKAKAKAELKYVETQKRNLLEQIENRQKNVSSDEAAQKYHAFHKIVRDVCNKHNVDVVDVL